MAYAAGNPIMSDAQFDQLKLRLKMFLLNVPATTVAIGLFFFIDELTGCEINIFQLPEPFGFIFTWFAALPLILFIAQSITNAIVKDFLILKGANSTDDCSLAIHGSCPNCGTENLSFFGTILSVSSGGETKKVKCANCSTEMVYDSKSRLITLPEPSQG